MVERRQKPPCSAAEGPVVRRLSPGGRWIRTSSTRARSIWLSALLGGLCFAIGCGSGRSTSGTARYQRRGWTILAAGLGAAHCPSDLWCARLGSTRRDDRLFSAASNDIRCTSPPCSSLAIRCSLGTRGATLPATAAHVEGLPSHPPCGHWQWLALQLGQHPRVGLCHRASRKRADIGRGNRAERPLTARRRRMRRPWGGRPPLSVIAKP